MTSRGGRLLAALLAVLVVLSVVPGPALAQEVEGVDMDRLVEVYNANVDQAPGIARGQLAGQRVELRIGEGSTVAGADTGSAYHFTTAENGTITDYGEGEPADPTVRVRTSEDAYFAIVESDDPAGEFDQQYEAGNVEINGIGLTNAVVVELVKLGVWLGKLFGLV